MRAFCLSMLLTLTACQMFSGLGRLELRDAGPANGTTSGPQSESDAGAEPGLAKGGTTHKPSITTDEPDAAQNLANSTAPEAGVSDAGAMGTSPFAGSPTPSNGGTRAKAGSGAMDAGAADASVSKPADASMPAIDAAVPCVPPPAGGPRCTAAPQCGCDKTENCAVLSDQLTCVTSGDIGENQACATVTDCAIGLECVAGACAKLCDPAHAQCSGGAHCIQLASSAGALISGAYFCESNCNLADPQHASGELTACGPGLVCGWSGTGTRCAQSERATHGHGEACKDALDCSPGYTCISDTGTCAKWCATNSDCSSDFTCNTSSPTTVGQKSFGTCKPKCLDVTEQVCGLTTQCGCDLDHSCSAVARSLVRVVHTCRELGPARSYDNCMYQEDCGRGDSCASSTCQPNCLSELECERYASCELSYYDEAPLIPAFSTCKRPCDPADPYRAHGAYSACPSGRACEVVDDGYSYCRSASLRGTAGTSCSSNSDCASGNTCIDDNYCVELCRNDDDCSTGTGTCRAFSTPQHAREVEWGYCDLGMQSMPSMPSE